MKKATQPTSKAARKASKPLRKSLDAMNKPAVVPKLDGHKVFGDVGMYEASRQAIDCIACLIYIASAKHFDNTPSFAKLRFDASELLADVAAHFIQRWPSQVHVTPCIWEIHRDKKSGFRQRWDSIRKSTKQNDAFVDDFARYTVWAFGWLDEPEQMRQYQADPETCWTKVLEPRGRKYWPNWISEDNIDLYYPKGEDKGHEALKVTGWTKGKWNARVKTAIKKLAKEKEYLKMDSWEEERPRAMIYRRRDLPSG